MGTSLQDIAATSAAGPSVAYRALIEGALDAVMVTDASLDYGGPRIRYVNPAFSRLTGRRTDEVVGRPAWVIEGPDGDQAAMRDAREDLRRGKPTTVKLLNYTKDGVPYWTDWRILPLFDGIGRVEGFAFFGRDVTNDQRRLIELEQLAHRDALTGLLNRREFLRRCEAAFAARTAGRFCCIRLALDGFEGSGSGSLVRDAVLIGVADLLSENTRRKDPVGRIDDSEFAVCLPTQLPAEAAGMAERLRRLVAGQQVSTPIGPLRVTCSIGLAGARGGDTLPGLLDRAAEARHRAAEAGGNLVQTEP